MKKSSNDAGCPFGFNVRTIFNLHFNHEISSVKCFFILKSNRKLLLQSPNALTATR